MLAVHRQARVAVVVIVASALRVVVVEAAVAPAAHRAAVATRMTTGVIVEAAIEMETGAGTVPAAQWTVTGT